LRLRLPLSADHARGQRCRLRLRPGEPVRLFPAGIDLQVAA
jgi:iron(III) transport system ATP-binding protein